MGGPGFLLSPGPPAYKEKPMASNEMEDVRKDIEDIKQSVGGLLIMFRHMAAELGDFAHNLSELGSQMMTRMGLVWESLGGKVEEETAPDSDEDEGADIIHFPHTEHDTT